MVVNSLIFAVQTATRAASDGNNLDSRDAGTILRLSNPITDTAATMRTLIQISDIHFGREDAAALAALESDIVRLSPDLLVVSGDLSQRARTRQLRAARAFLDRVPIPKLVIPGNHDIPVYDVIGRFVDPYRRYRREVSHDLAPLRFDDELTVVGLNTARRLVFDFSQGRISPAQTSRAREVFHARPENTFRIVVTHHPLLRAPCRPNKGAAWGGARAVAELERIGVDLLLAGHFHRVHAGTTPGGTPFVLAGTAISTRRRGEANSYNLITVERPDVTVETRAWNGAGFETGTVTRIQSPRTPR